MIIRYDKDADTMMIIPSDKKSAYENIESIREGILDSRHDISP
jgi:hypothetical protein